MNLLVRKLNSAYYRYRENRWRWHPRFRRLDPSLAIDRPIFLLGVGGGGLTLTARILRRVAGVVSVTGDHHYWAGNDEMQNVLQDVLLESFSWRQERVAGFTRFHSNVYGCDDLYPYYHEGAEDVTDEKREHFRSILQRTIALNRDLGLEGAPRFLDKSQTFTLRVGLLQSILEEARPRFLLIVRDPFAMCWRGVRKARTLANLDKSDEEKLDIAIQHWKNNMQEALDHEADAGVRWWRFEDLLAEPERVVGEMCSVAELPFGPILPGPDDVIPWGSASDAFDRHKWYPLRTDVSRGYLREIPDWAVERIAEGCAPLIARFGYTPPERSG